MIYPQNFEQKIGFDSIRHLLKERCLSTLGEERVNDMAFSEDYREINRRLEEVNEFIRIIQEEDEFPDQYFFDVRPSLKRIRVEGMYMEEQELFDLRRSLETIRDIVRFLQRTSDEEEGQEGAVTPYPYLRNLAGDILVFPQLISRINNILDKYGKIRDNASSELLRIRRELASTTGSISRSLHAILRNAQAEGYVDKDVTPTMRDGRLVIPIAPGLKRKIKGIVHDESATGKTVFIEPAEVGTRLSTAPTFSETSRMVMTLEWVRPTSLTMPTRPSSEITGSRGSTPWWLPLSMVKEPKRLL